MGIDLRNSPVEYDPDLMGYKTGTVDANNKPVYLFFGIRATRATVLSDLGNQPGVGSVYFGRGEMYIKVADTGASTDWEVIGHSAADAG